MAFDVEQAYYEEGQQMPAEQAPAAPAEGASIPLTAEQMTVVQELVKAGSFEELGKLVASILGA